MLKVSCAIHQRLFGALDAVNRRLDRREKGQATAEYALVLLLAAVVAFVVTKYFSQSGDSNPLTNIVGQLTGKIWGIAKHFVPFL